MKLGIPDSGLRRIAQSSDEPYIDAHRSGDIVWIDMMEVPTEQRGQGVGRRVYEEWEASLPEDVKYIMVYAADTEGRGHSDMFWEALGFEWRWYSEFPEDLGDEGQHTMIKGVNGNPTPEPVFVGPEDYE
jgi:hypothetical protein